MILRKAILLLYVLPSFAFGQEAIPSQQSPIAIETGRYKSTYLKITYCRPHKRGREIFGKLVPYGQVWRTGANQATEITLTQDILVNSSLLKAGTYSIFSIPEKNKWTIIFNGDLGLWGSYNYNQKMDVLRFDVPTQFSPAMYEPFTISVDQKNEKGEIILLWDHVKVSFPVAFIDTPPNPATPKR